MNHPLDSRQLRAFFALAKAGSFTTAGKQLFLSQSAVSHSIKALEEDVGCRLFDRVGKKVWLTLAGEQLLKRAERIFTEMNSARAELHQLGKWGQGRLRIGASTTGCQYILPPVIKEFRKLFPEYRLGLLPRDTEEAIALLTRNEAEIVLALESMQDESVESIPLFWDEMAFVVSPDHPWAQAGRARREDIPRQQFILYYRSSQTYRIVENYFRKEEIVLNTVMELGSMEAIKELVKQDLGISVLATWIVNKEVKDGSLVALPLGRRRLRRDWSIFHLRNRKPTMAEERFVTLLRNWVSRNIQMGLLPLEDPEHVEAKI